ncbi:MAG: D-tyrosyl-tRNA(Tyr) deacylase [Candidatus Eremiobacteraeota bacterium]|nr:D-tyrosyl-tRNA(Tyr) deacylase [Candidatus Eremiobacteraeota bacterium]
MRAVVQRVRRACVRVQSEITASIQTGLLVLLGVGVEDGEADAKTIARKLATLRIFDDSGGLMNRSATEASGSILLVSQFTLYGDARKGRRPSFIMAAREIQAKALYELTGHELTLSGLVVAYGTFGAKMQVELINDGPVTILLDSKKLF